MSYYFNRLPWLTVSVYTGIIGLSYLANTVHCILLCLFEKSVEILFLGHHTENWKIKEYIFRKHSTSYKFNDSQPPGTV